MDYSLRLFDGSCSILVVHGHRGRLESYGLAVHALVVRYHYHPFLFLISYRIFIPYYFASTTPPIVHLRIHFEVLHSFHLSCERCWTRILTFATLLISPLPFTHITFQLSRLITTAFI